jgi:hypothetical protein
VVGTQCPFCKHYRGELTCAAYPEGIPEAILTGEFDHAEEYPGDSGVRYEPAPPDEGPIMTS